VFEYLSLFAQRQPFNALDELVDNSADFVFVDYAADVNFNIIFPD